MDALPKNHRKRCKRWDIPGSAHYLTFSCFARRPFFTGRRSPQWFVDAVDQARAKLHFDLWAWVIMPEHVHLLILPAEGVGISQVLYQVKKPVTTWALSWTRRHAPQFLPRMLDVQPNGQASHRFWLRGGGYDRNLRSVPDVHEKIVYIHANPVRRGLVERPEQWPWSSSRAWAEEIDQPLRIDRESLPPLVR